MLRICSFSFWAGGTVRSETAPFKQQFQGKCRDFRVGDSAENCCCGSAAQGNMRRVPFPATPSSVHDFLWIQLVRAKPDLTSHEPISVCALTPELIPLEPYKKTSLVRLDHSPASAFSLHCVSHWGNMANFTPQCPQIQQPCRRLML